MRRKAGKNHRKQAEEHRLPEETGYGAEERFPAGSSFRQYIFVIRELTGREIKRKYARSYLGILWSVLNPLLSMAVMTMIFSTIFKRNIENYPIYYLTGSIFWSLFTEATNSAMTALVDNKSMLIKVRLPMEIFPLSRCFTAMTNFGYSLVAYTVMLFVSRIPFTPYMLMIFLYAGMLFLFALGVGYFLSVLYTIFGDIKHLYSIMLTLLMYASAIFYPVESTSEMMQKIIKSNPVYNYIACARKCMLEAAMPDSAQWMKLFVWSIGMFLFGKIFFHKMRNRVLQKV